MEDLKEEGIVEPQESEEPTDVIEETPAEPEEGGEGEAAPVQSPEDNAKYAAARRAAEAVAAKERASREAAEANLQKLLGAVKHFGYEGDVEDIIDALEAQKRGAGVTAEQIRAEREAHEAQLAAAIANNPVVKQAQTVIQQLEITRELSEIQKINPNIKSMEELAKNSTPEFNDLVLNHGIPLSKAYKLTYKPGKAAKQDTKAHLDGVNAGGKSIDDLKEVPPEDLEILRINFPDDSPAKLKERYNRIIKRRET